MSNTNHKNTVRLRVNKSGIARAGSANLHNASKVYANYELMLQLYYITKQQATPAKQFKTRAFLPSVRKAL